MNKNFMINFIKNSLMNLPTPINISYWWNMGSLLGMFFMVQIISGLFLSMHYCPNISLAFQSMIHIMQNTNYGWLMHNIHMNSASMFFICMYLHIARGLYYMSYKLKKTWLIGTTIFITSMATAFLGYVLPWGQMSFWGATVITNLMSTIPFIGFLIIEWVWGGFSINNATLNRFYSFHFILPFILLMLILLHLYMLHSTGSSNPLGTSMNMNKISFNIYFTLKDLVSMLLFMLIILIIILQYPYMLSDPDNFTLANPLITPIHIQPEWYFLFAYAILRSIPNKLGGVIALLMSIMILYLLPLMTFMKLNSLMFYPFNQLLFWLFMNLFILLTWFGAQIIEYPYMLISQILTCSYFFYFILFNFLIVMWDQMMFKTLNL